MLHIFSRIQIRLILLAFFLTAAFTSSPAFAQRWSLQNIRCATVANCFYVVEKPLTISVSVQGKTSRVTFKPGQQVMFKKESGKYTVAVQTRSGKTWYQNRVGITPSELDEHFSEPIESDGKSLRPAMTDGLPLVGRGVKLATTPQAAGDLGPGGMTFLKPSAFPKSTDTTLDQSRLVDAGTGKASNWYLAQHVCFGMTNGDDVDRCGWVQGNQIAQPGKPAATASMSPPPPSRGSGSTPSTPGRQYPCTHGSGLAEDTIYKLREVTALLTREASKAEVEARNALMDHVGSCAFWPPQLPAAEIEKKIRPFDSKDMNLYDALVREKVIQEWERITPPKSNQLGALRVRSKGKSRPINRLDFIKIDVLARTIYGENRFCASQPGHLEATARTMVNRARINKPANFEKAGGLKAFNKRTNQYDILPQGFKEDDPLYRVTLSDKQYSVWNNADEVGGDLASHLENSRGSLCPAINSSGHGDSNAWAQSVSVAMSAILEPDIFMKETDDFKNLLFYTSYEAQYTDTDKWQKLPNPSFDGKPLNTPRKCMVFFADKTKNYKVP